MTSRGKKKAPGASADTPQRKPGRPKKPDPRRVTLPEARVVPVLPPRKGHSYGGTICTPVGDGPLATPPVVAPAPPAPPAPPALPEPPSTPAQQLPQANARTRQIGELAKQGQRLCQGIRTISSPRSLIPLAPCARAAAPGQVYCEVCLRDYHHQLALKAVLPPDWHARMEAAARGAEGLAAPHQDGFARMPRRDAALDAGRRRLLAARACYKDLTK